MNLPISILFSLMFTISVGPFQNQAVRIFNQKNQLQSEGAEILYTDMTLTPIRELPAEVLKRNH
jgi:hypothetical protein